MIRGASPLGLAYTDAPAFAEVTAGKRFVCRVAPLRLVRRSFNEGDGRACGALG